MDSMSRQSCVQRQVEKRREAERKRSRHLKRRLRDTYGIYRLKRSELFVVYRHYYDFWGAAEENEGILRIDHTGWLKF
jgi:hypothetical protein